MTKDGQNSAEANINMGGNKLTNGATATLAGDFPIVSDIQAGKFVYATSGGAADVQTLTLSPAETAYAEGQVFTFTAGFTNTGATTLNVNAIGAITIKKLGNSTDLAANDIIAGQIVTVHYDGTVFQMDFNPENVAAGLITLGAASLTTNTFTGDQTFTAAILTPDDGELTISSGVITVTGNYHTVDTESDASTDDLDTINTGADGKRITLRIENDARNVVIKNGTGNILTPDGNDITLDTTDEVISLIFDTALSNWLVTAQGKRTAVSLTPTIQKFPASGTWTRPTGCTKIKVTTTAGGGSGADAATGSANGGGAGATVIELIDVTAISSVTVTIGSGGAGSTGDGNAGGTSSFGTHNSVTGGAAGTSSVAGDGGTVATGGDVDLVGGGGRRGTGVASGSSYTGQGGDSYWGAGGKAVISGNGNVGVAFGAGGSGSVNGNTSGAGADGFCLVEESYP